MAVGCKKYDEGNVCDDYECIRCLNRRIERLVEIVKDQQASLEKLGTKLLCWRAAAIAAGVEEN